MTLYEILEVSEKASEEIIEKAYKTLAKKYHPDLQPDQEQKSIASEKMKKINEAYSILSDNNKRREYDEKLEADRQRKEFSNSRNTQYNYEQTVNNVRQQSENQTQNQSQYENQENNVNYRKAASINNWRDLLYQLTKEERAKITRKIQKDAKREYESMYRDYFRSMGYRVKRKITFREICSIIILICIFIITLWILWKIPASRRHIIELYRNNMVFKILIDLVYGIFKGLISSIQLITK